MPGEEPEQEGLLTSAAEAAEAEETETLVGHSSLEEDEEEEEDKQEDARQRRRRRQQQQQQHQTAASGMEQLTYSRMAHLLAVYQNKVRRHFCIPVFIRPRGGVAGLRAGRGVCGLCVSLCGGAHWEWRWCVYPSRRHAVRPCPGVVVREAVVGRPAPPRRPLA